MANIIKAVGAWEKGASNFYKDVHWIQTLLKAAAEDEDDPAYDPGDPDGKIAKPSSNSSTVKAIKAFQRRFMSNPDGLIEPGRNTFNKLAAYTPDDDWLDLPMIASLLKFGQNAVKGAAAGAPHAPGGGNCCFPLAKVPGYSYAKYGLRFGAKRKKKKDGEVIGYRKHAGCDLYKLDQGTPVYAVDNGKVIKVERGFYGKNSDALAIQHDAGFQVRYGEIYNIPSKFITKNAEVQRGEVIGHVSWTKMLHLEMYSGEATGPYTQKNQSYTKTFGKDTPFMRRSDLLDPTPFLNKWKTHLPL